MVQKKIYRKPATKLLLINWGRFQYCPIQLNGSVLLDGKNGIGKSMILDAITYLLAGNRTKFNQAATDKDRTVLGYVRGDTGSNDKDRYLRSGAVISYIAMEFWDPMEQAYFVVAVCTESPSENQRITSYWFICKDTKIDQINFATIDNDTIHFTPRNELVANGRRLKPSDFKSSKTEGIGQVMRALGLRCDMEKYKSKLLKMIAFKPENNIDKFIQECVLDEGTIENLDGLREQREQLGQLQEQFNSLKEGKQKLEIAEAQAVEYEKKRTRYEIREMMLCYQELHKKEQEAEESKLRFESYVSKLESLEQQEQRIKQEIDDANERIQAAESDPYIADAVESRRVLEQQLNKLNEEISRYQTGTAKLKKVQVKLNDLLGRNIFDLSDADKKTLLSIAEKECGENKKFDAFQRLFKQATTKADELHAVEINACSKIQQILQELRMLESKAEKLRSNHLALPADIERAKCAIKEGLLKKGIKADVRTLAELVQDVKDPSWREALETYLGKRRFNFIVDKEHCHAALRVMQKEHIRGRSVILTDKLQAKDPEEGSAAEMLIVPNADARKYINYLLGHIILCDTLEDLHNHPLGGLMKDGMLASGYTVTKKGKMGERKRLCKETA